MVLFNILDVFQIIEQPEQNRTEAKTWFIDKPDTFHPCGHASSGKIAVNQ